MWYSSFRSKYKIQPMEKFSGEGSFLFQNDSEPDLWGARFAKQGQVLQVRSISRPLRPPRSWPPTKVCPENWNFKGWGQQIYFFLQILSRTTWILTGKPWKCQRKLWTGAGKAVCWSRQEKLWSWKQAMKSGWRCSMTMEEGKWNTLAAVSRA